MYHLIEFNAAFTADVEIWPRDRLERVQIRNGTRVSVYLMPRIVESAHGPIEVADLCFEDGSVSRQVPYEKFRFVE